MVNMKQFENKSSGHGELIFYSLCIILVVAFERFMAFILKPLTDRNVTDDVPEYLEAKQRARRSYLNKIARDPNDPMSQFQARFLVDPKGYRGNPDNKIYKNWYTSWKKGEILDSNLRWVPEIYDNDSFTPEFLQYMKIQYALHMKASWTSKAKFLNTIRRFYPEFTASFKGMAQDLAKFSTMVEEDTLSNELLEELVKFGLSEELAEYLAEKNLTTKETQRQAEFLKTCTERGYVSSVAICALENGCDTEEVRVINMMVNKLNLPAKVGLAYLRKEVTIEDLDDIRLVLSSDDMDETVEDVLTTFRSRKRAQKLA